MLPRLLNDVKELTTEVGTAFDYTTATRYCSLISQTKYIAPDGTSKTGLPEGIEKNIDYTKKQLTLSGTFAEEGDYQFIIALTGLGSEKVNDTITVHVLPNASGISEIENSQLSNSKYYDLQGRAVSNPRPGTLYIDRQRRIVRK